MTHSFFCCYDQMPKGYQRYSGQDLAKEITEQTQIICRAVDILKGLDAQRKQPQPPSEDHQKQECEKEVDEGSEYIPSNSDSSTDEDDVASKTPPTKSSSPSPKRPRQTDDKKSSSPSPKRPRQTEPSAATPPPSSSSDTGRSHHKKKQCPVPKCTFSGNDLQRHLHTHVRKNEISSEAEEKLLSIVRAGDETHGKRQVRKGKQPVKGRQRKWCPVPGCHQLVLDMARHLENPTLHGFARESKVHIRYLRMATPYTGLEELEDQLTPPPPAIVEVIPKHDSSPVFAASTRVSPSTRQSAILQDASSATVSAAATASTATSVASSGTTSAAASAAASPAAPAASYKNTKVIFA